MDLLTIAEGLAGRVGDETTKARVPLVAAFGGVDLSAPHLKEELI